MDYSREEQKILENIDLTRIPLHLAIIMDGNGRWAEEQGLPRREGHRQGVENVRKMVKNCNALGIKYLTLFAFSTENWKRPIQEINYLMSLPEIYFKTELPELMRNNVRVRMIGDPNRLPQKVQKAVNEGMEKTAGNSGMTLIFALNYGARAEIVNAINQIIGDIHNGKLAKEVNEKAFSGYLDTAGCPDPDLLIRTSGEQRISNFLLWQLAYSEMWFTDVYWPDFSRLHLLQALQDYQARKRRFGKI